MIDLRRSRCDELLRADVCAMDDKILDGSTRCMYQGVERMTFARRCMLARDKAREVQACVRN